MAFLCVCPEKAVELWCDEKLHRAAREEEIERFLDAAQLGGSGKKVVKVLPGGGVTMMCEAGPPKIGVDGAFVAAITGSLQNYAYLVKKYLHEELHLPPTVTLEAIKERKPISEPVLLCRLYAQLGTVMLSKLRGHFSIVIYDSTTVRVLAARDPSGAVPLTHGQLADNALFVTTSSFRPTGAHSVSEINPGHYKFGWRASPRKYTNPETEAKSHAQAASSAAEMALAGILRAPAAAGRRSLDALTRSTALRAKTDNIWDSGRRSLDSNSQRRGVDCQKSRADEHGWWRSKDSSSDAKTPPPDENAPPAPQPKRKRHRRRNRKPKTTQPESVHDRSSDSGSEVVSVISVQDVIERLPNFLRQDSASARMLKNLLGCSPCSLVVTDAGQSDNPIVFVNDRFEAATGYCAQDAVGKNCRFLQSPPGGPRVLAAGSGTIRKALEDGKSASVKLMNYKKDGTPVWNELSIVPLRDAEGKITHHVGMQTFTPVRDTGLTTTESAATFKPRFLRSRSCSDMSTMGAATPRSLANLAF